MKNLFACLSLLTVSCFYSMAQQVDYQTKPDSITRWEDMDLATTPWESVKAVFVPADLKKTTLIVETKTLEQHKKYFRGLFTDYYLENNIDTNTATFTNGKAAFLKEQEKETEFIKNQYKGKVVFLNETELPNFNTTEYRYVLKKIMKINKINPGTGEGEAFIEYFFYDRKENRYYSHIKAGHQWLISHL